MHTKSASISAKKGLNESPRKLEFLHSFNQYLQSNLINVKHSNECNCFFYRNMLEVPCIDLFLKHIYTVHSLHCAKIAFVFPSHSFSQPKKFVAICNRNKSFSFSYTL